MHVTSCGRSKSPVSCRDPQAPRPTGAGHQGCQGTLLGRPQATGRHIQSVTCANADSACRGLEALRSRFCFRWGSPLSPLSANVSPCYAAEIHNRREKEKADKAAAQATGSPEAAGPGPRKVSGVVFTPLPPGCCHALSHFVTSYHVLSCRSPWRHRTGSDVKWKPRARRKRSSSTGSRSELPPNRPCWCAGVAVLSNPLARALYIPPCSQCLLSTLVVHALHSLWLSTF